MTAVEINEAIASNNARIADFRINGTKRMSKTGVKWCIWSLRESNKRLRQSLKELRRTL